MRQKETTNTATVMKQPSINNLKRGSTVFIWSNDHRLAQEEDKVKSIGPKFITTYGPRWRNRFKKDNLDCEDWSSYTLFPGTEEEFNRYKEEKEEFEVIYDQLIKKMHSSLTLEQIKQISEIVDSHISRDR